MYPTRRGWTVAALAGVLAILAAVFARPLVLVGSAFVGAWLVAHQYRFVRDLERTIGSLSVVQSPAQTAVRTATETPVTLAATCGAETALTLEVAAGLPVGAATNDRIAVTLDPDAERADRTRAVTWPVAGRHSFESATVTATDGLFRETITVGPTPMVTVEPPRRRTIHVGKGGDRISTSYGTHDAGRSGSGIELAELREYVPGDTGKEIDWNATARHGSPYVREYEAETDRRTMVVVDHRASLATGPRGETKLEALREVAVLIAGNARRLNDPLGLVTVGDDGITEHVEMAAPTVNYGSIRRRLLELEPTPADEHRATGVSGRDRSGPADQLEGGDHATPSNNRTGSTASEAPPSTADRTSATRVSSHRGRTTPTDARRSLADLEGDDDAFARTLRPFYADRQRYRERIAEDPLYGAVHRGVTNAHGSLWTVICTDDSRRGELRETVSLARRGGNEVTVLLAPSVLYEPGGLADVERAYDGYVAFEEFRRELARMDDVTALEVGPADRLSAILEAGRSRGDRA
ncbi:DUF58 domain-containing protein [Natrinema salaciae]|uniref:Uncharacterized conserved protein, DUF58 family, contains vWF domain n=1 Tax=Natrinema salaciae TaxID=1186196 RepID=A0A1H9BYC5_9EURY|nr:DUF58 domain-containing protein [Natrinema salaciae]SEP93388.1 Uncharacterized conserved protein, DUF58 family, contains vWF domain [Natrinema salaciae]